MTEVEVEAPPEEQTEDQGTIMEGIEIIEGGAEEIEEMGMATEEETEETVACPRVAKSKRALTG